MERRKMGNEEYQDVDKKLIRDDYMMNMMKN